MSTVPTTDPDVMLNSLGPTADFPHWTTEETSQMVESSNVNSEALATFSQQPAATGKCILRSETKLVHACLSSFFVLLS
jgi:hypothetical protein